MDNKDLEKISSLIDDIEIAKIVRERKDQVAEPMTELLIRLGITDDTV